MEQIHYYFYETRNLINGKKYLGVHSTSRFLKDGYLGSGTAIKNAIRKYGRKNFSHTVLKEFRSAEEMFEYEKQIVTEEIVNNPEYYNEKLGGKGGMRGYHHTEEWKKATSLRQLGRKGPMKGKHHSEESRQKKSETSRGMIWIHRGTERTMIHPKFWEEYQKQGFEKGSGLPSPRKGATLSEETKEKLRNRQIKPISEETRKKLSEAHKGRKRGPMTEEHKRALSESHRGYKRSPESVQKQVETRKRKKDGGADL